MSYDPLLPSFQRSLPTLSSLSASSSARNSPPAPRSPPHALLDSNAPTRQGPQTSTPAQNQPSLETVPVRAVAYERWAQHPTSPDAPLAAPPTDPSSRPAQIPPQVSSRALTSADRSTAHPSARGPGNWQYQQPHHGSVGGAIKAEEEEPGTIGPSPGVSGVVHRQTYSSPLSNQGSHSYHHSSTTFQEPSASLSPHYQLPPLAGHAPRAPSSSYVPNQPPPSPQSPYQYQQQTISRTTVIHQQQQNYIPTTFNRGNSPHSHPVNCGCPACVSGSYPTAPVPVPQLESSRPPAQHWEMPYEPSFDQEPMRGQTWPDQRQPMARSSSNRPPQWGTHPNVPYPRMHGPPSPAPELAPAVYSPERYPYPNEPPPRWANEYGQPYSYQSTHQPMGAGPSSLPNSSVPWGNSSDNDPASPLPSSSPSSSRQTDKSVKHKSRKTWTEVEWKKLTQLAEQSKKGDPLADIDWDYVTSGFGGRRCRQGILTVAAKRGLKVSTREARTTGKRARSSEDPDDSESAMTPPPNTRRA